IANISLLPYPIGSGMVSGLGKRHEISAMNDFEHGREPFIAEKPTSDGLMFRSQSSTCGCGTPRS
ncbi:MAG: hypothetical protein ACRD72_24570, partial [Candidatus Angelobacter sp.]